jgi:hypothetical protein
MQAWSHTRAIAESMNIISSYNNNKKNPSLLEDPILSQIYKRITEFKLFFFIIINLASQYPKSKPVQTLRTVNHLCCKKKAIKAWKIELERTKTFWLEPSTGKLW